MEPLTPERWQHIRALFDAALDQPPADRAAYLDRACEGDDALRAEVEALLAAEAAEDALLDGSLETQAGGLIGELVAAQDTAGAEAGRRIGTYRVLRELGRGGMSVVYLAERSDGQFEQRVALKLIKRGMDTDLVLHRFRQERQILARLQHPHIARLYDGGITDDGQPYFAMEYIAGAPLLAYCKARRLGIEERLRLFIAIGEAIQFAHRNLIVHRDLKPSNILVTDDGVVKLLDFGIAKLLSEDETEAIQTRTGQRFMTPAYAAPEQVRGEPVTTATDVYALGVLLYELLTGQRPAQPAGTADDPAQAVTVIQPDRPSSMVLRSDSVPGPEAVARARGLSPVRLRKRLRGDLDTICLMALRQEPERRYSSAEAFAADVRRHLDGLPVAAQPDALGYRVRKFVGRHRRSIGAAVLVMVSLVGGLTAAVWQAQVARQERDAKEVEAARANLTLEYILDLFESLDPIEAQGRRFTSRELVEPGIRRLDNLAQQPQEQAAVAQVLGQTAESLGLLTMADSLFEAALATQEATLDPDEPALAKTLEGWALVQLQLQAYDRAETLLQRALQIRAPRFEQDGDPAYLATLNQYAYLLYNQDRLEEAADQYRRVLDFIERHAAPTLERGRSLRGLAEVLVRRGDVDAAIPLFEEALAIYRVERGDAHSETGRTRFGLAQAWQQAEAWDQADSLFQEALRINRRVFGSAHPSVATVLYHLGTTNEAAGRLEAAARYYQESADLRRQVLPDPHLHTAYALEQWGTILLRLDRPAEAAAPLRQAQAVYEGVDSAEDLVRNRVYLAVAQVRRGRLAEADALLQANEVVLRAWPEPMPNTVRFIYEQTLRGLMQVSERQGQAGRVARYQETLAQLSAGE